MWVILSISERAKLSSVESEGKADVLDDNHYDKFI